MSSLAHVLDTIDEYLNRGSSRYTKFEARNWYRNSADSILGLTLAQGRIKELEAALSIAGEEHHCCGCCALCAKDDHRDVRNAALEEAAVDFLRWGEDPDDDLFSPANVAARIRALKEVGRG